MKQLKRFELTWYDYETNSDESEILECFNKNEAIVMVQEGIGDNYGDIISDIEVTDLGYSDNNDECVY